MRAPVQPDGSSHKTYDDFDFLHYAKFRLDQYHRTKRELLTREAESSFSDRRQESAMKNVQISSLEERIDSLTKQVASNDNSKPEPGHQYVNTMVIGGKTTMIAATATALIGIALGMIASRSK